MSTLWHKVFNMVGSALSDSSDHTNLLKIWFLIKFSKLFSHKFLSPIFELFKHLHLADSAFIWLRQHSCS